MKKYIKANNNISINDATNLMETGYVGLVSAFRGYYSEEENIRRSKNLHSLILRSGFDAYTVTGSYKEETMEKPEREQSFLVYSEKDISLNAFRQYMAALAAKYQQDSYFILNNGNGELWSRQSLQTDNVEKLVYETVNRNDYSHLTKFSHITMEQAFSAYTEAFDGVYSIFADTLVQDRSYYRVYRKQPSCAIYNATIIRRTRNNLLQSTDMSMSK